MCSFLSSIIIIYHYFPVPFSSHSKRKYPSIQQARIQDQKLQNSSLSIAAAINPTYATPFQFRPVSLAAAASELLDSTPLPAGAWPNTPPSPALKVAAAAGIVLGVGVIRNPCSSNDFGTVAHPACRVIVVGKPRSSQPVIVSKPSAGEGGDDGEGEGPGEEIDVDGAKVCISVSFCLIY